MQTTYFNTPSRWLEDLRSWAESEPEIIRLWLFGSRASGRRRPKENPPAIPDIDLAFECAGDFYGERLNTFIVSEGRWREAITAYVPIPLDLVPYDPSRGDAEAKYVESGRVLIYGEEP